MNLSFYDLQRDLGYLMHKLAQDNNTLLNERKSKLADIINLFSGLDIDNLDSVIKSKISKYREELERLALSEIVDFNENILFDFLKKYSDQIKKAKEKLIELSSNDAALINNKDYLLKLREVIDLLSFDIKIYKRKIVDSYFENTSKFLNAKQIKILSNIIMKIQEEISSIWKNYINFGADNIYKQIITNPQFNVDSRINADKQELRALDIEGDKLLMSHIHTLATKGGGTVTGKNAPFYLNSPSLYDKDYKDLNKKFNDFNSVFSRINIGFRDIDHLKKKYAKLEAYSQVSGDSGLLQNFIITLRNINRTTPDKFESKILNSSSFYRLEEEKEKLKIIFRLKLNEETLKLLKNYKIFQRGNECKFVANPNTNPTILSEVALSAISSDIKKSSFNKYYQKYFKIIK